MTFRAWVPRAAGLGGDSFSGTAAPRQLGLLWGAVSLTMLALVPWAPGLALGLPGCIVKQTVGLPCPACGSTRAALALTRLDFLGAFTLNPLATLGLLFLLTGGLAAGTAAIAGRPIVEPSAYPIWLRLALPLAVALNWGWLVMDGR